MLKRLIPLFFILLLPHFLRAQDVAVYPIDVTAIITPPYGTCLKDYVGSRRFMVNVLLRDMTKRPDDFVIEMSVKNSGNRVVFRSYFGNLSLNPGKPFYQDSELQNGFISQLFDPNNILVGNQFATKCFDEGAYSISFQAFAAYNYPNRRIPLSRASTSTLFMQSTVQGPYLIFPYDKDSLDCSIATINYQWQSANPTGEAVSYHLQVVEVPEGFSGYNSFETATTFVENQPNLFHSTFQSIVSAEKYRPNTTYAWRVIVKTREHEHISPVRTFVYCGTPQAPVNEIPYDPILTFKPIDDKLHPLHIDSVDTTSISALAYWKKNPEIAPNEYCGIAVEVRKQGQEKWTPYRLETADTSKIQLENLSYGTLYEARGQYIKCDGEDFIYGPYGDTIQFIIPDPVRAADCGDDIPPLADCGDNKGKILGIGDTIFANGTNVIIDTVFYSGEDSTIISGKGHIEFPIIRNVHVKMEFNDIQINCAGQLAKGVISTIYDPSTSLMIDVEELIGQGSTGGADKPVSNSEVNKYDKESFDSSPEGSFFVKDDSTVVMKDENGTEVPIGKLISLSSDQYASKNSLLSPSHFLEFINLDPKNIAFDKDTFGYYSKIAPGDYHKYSEAGDRNYIIPWLANNPGKTKKLYVKEVLLDRKVSLFDSVKFVMPTNGDFIELNHTPLGEGFFSVDIPGGASTKNSFEVYALGKMKESSSYGDAGKLMVENYPTRKNKVIFVPVQNDYKLGNELEKSLNDIYGRLGITYEVELAEKFENELLQDILSDGLDISADDESRWQVESEEMKMLRYLYRQHLQEQGKDIEKNAAYIFLVDKAQEPYQSVEGDMPRNQSVGYIFMQGNTSLSDARLVAHELGHGVYRLQHTFDYKHAEEDKYKTDNLMDYNQGDFLAHYQWRIMQDSVMFVWKSLQDDEDGMLTIPPCVYKSVVSLVSSSVVSGLVDFGINQVLGSDIEKEKSLSDCIGAGFADNISMPNIVKTVSETCFDLKNFEYLTNALFNAGSSAKDYFDCMDEGGDVCHCSMKSISMFLMNTIIESLKIYLKNKLKEKEKKSNLSEENKKNICEKISEALVGYLNIESEKGVKFATVVFESLFDELKNGVSGKITDEISDYFVDCICGEVTPNLENIRMEIDKDKILHVYLYTKITESDELNKTKAVIYPFIGEIDETDPCNKEKSNKKLEPITLASNYLDYNELPKQGIFESDEKFWEKLSYSEKLSFKALMNGEKKDVYAFVFKETFCSDDNISSDKLSLYEVGVLTVTVEVFNWDGDYYGWFVKKSKMLDQRVYHYIAKLPCQEDQIYTGRVVAEGTILNGDGNYTNSKTDADSIDYHCGKPIPDCSEEDDNNGDDIVNEPIVEKKLVTKNDNCSGTNLFKATKVGEANAIVAANQKRITAECNYGLPKCSKWIQDPSNKNVYHITATAHDCEGNEVEITNLFTITLENAGNPNSGKRVLNQNVAKMYEYYEFSYDSECNAVDSILFRNSSGGVEMKPSGFFLDEKFAIKFFVDVSCSWIDKMYLNRNTPSLDLLENQVLDKIIKNKRLYPYTPITSIQRYQTFVDLLLEDENIVAIIKEAISKLDYGYCQKCVAFRDVYFAVAKALADTPYNLTSDMYGYPNSIFQSLKLVTTNDYKPENESDGMNREKYNEEEANAKNESVLSSISNYLSVYIAKMKAIYGPMSDGLHYTHFQYLPNNTDTNSYPNIIFRLRESNKLCP